MAEEFDGKEFSNQIHFTLRMVEPLLRLTREALVNPCPHCGGQWGEPLGPVFMGLPAELILVHVPCLSCGQRCELEFTGAALERARRITRGPVGSDEVDELRQMDESELGSAWPHSHD